MLFIRHKNGVLPFGTIVSVPGEQDNNGIVGDGGSVYLSGLPQKGTLKAVWGTGIDKSCKVSYLLERQFYTPQTGLYSQEAVCQ